MNPIEHIMTVELCRTEFLKKALDRALFNVSNYS
jgi:hypothetical protein